VRLGAGTAQPDAQRLMLCLIGIRDPMMAGNRPIPHLLCSLLCHVGHRPCELHQVLMKMTSGSCCSINAVGSFERLWSIRRVRRVGFAASLGRVRFCTTLAHVILAYMRPTRRSRNTAAQLAAFSAASCRRRPAATTLPPPLGVCCPLPLLCTCGACLSCSCSSEDLTHAIPTS